MSDTKGELFEIDYEKNGSIDVVRFSIDLKDGQSSAPFGFLKTDGQYTFPVIKDDVSNNLRAFIISRSNNSYTITNVKSNKSISIEPIIQTPIPVISKPIPSKPITKSNPAVKFMYSGGAINNITGNHTDSNYASKYANYSCPDCGERVIFCNGSVRRPYFRHWRSYGCDYYS